MSDNSWYEKGELPPVGSKCKFTGRDEDDCLEHERAAKGQEVEIACHFDTQACRVAGFLFKGKCGEVFIGQARYDYFEPIKTEKERAIDEIKAIVVSQGWLSADGTVSADIANKIYDAGYRKNNSRLIDYQ